MGHRQRRRTRVKGEKGYVLIMAALLLLPLLAFAGFAVDIGSWYTYANRMQRAADAAALAGVVWMPNDEKAEQVASRRRRPTASTTPPRTSRSPSPPSATGGCGSYIHGHDRAHVLLDGLPERGRHQTPGPRRVRASVPMGSPDNTLGNDPDTWSASGYTRPYYWLNVARRDLEKHQGDRYTANDCTGTYTGCSTSSASGENLDYSESGYFYRLHVDTKPASGGLTSPGLRPSVHARGSSCSDANLPGRRLDVDHERHDDLQPGSTA